jgi:hypothetical protein
MTMTDVGLGDLDSVVREEFLYAVEVARAQHDPSADWEGFRETLWSYLSRVFGVDLAADGRGAGGADEPPTPTAASVRGSAAGAR